MLASCNCFMVIILTDGITNGNSRVLPLWRSINKNCGGVWKLEEQWKYKKVKENGKRHCDECALFFRENFREKDQIRRGFVAFVLCEYLSLAYHSE